MLGSILLIIVVILLVLWIIGLSLMWGNWIWLAFLAAVIILIINLSNPRLRGYYQ